MRGVALGHLLDGDGRAEHEQRTAQFVGGAVLARELVRMPLPGHE